MTISIPDLRKIDPITKKQHIPIDGKGLRWVIEKSPFNCKRIEGVTRLKGKQVYISLGVLGKDVQTKKDLNEIIEQWSEIKKWSKVQGRHPKLWFHKNDLNKSEITLQEVFDSYMEKDHKKKVKEVTWRVTQNRLNQILDYFGKDCPLSEFELGKESREKVMKMYDFLSIGKRHQGAIDHARRCRNLLKIVFRFARSEGYMDENPVEQNDRVGVGHIKKSNPTINWDEVPELMKSIHENKCDGTKLTQLALKLHLMICIRVGVVVRLEWDWYDNEKKMWEIPPETSGLKRKKGTTSDDYSHYIPVTHEMRQVIDEIRTFTGFQKYVFFSAEGKIFPHLNPETINTYLRRLGWGGRLTAHGWRDVPVTAGQEIGGFPREIIRRQIGHTDHKKGAIGSYDNTQFLEKRRKFMNWWTKELVNQGMVI